MPRLGKSQMNLCIHTFLPETKLLLLLKKDGHRGHSINSIKLEDLKVLKHSPDLLNNVKIGEGQLRLII